MDKKPLQRLFSYLLPHKKRLFLAVVCMVIFSIVTSYQAMLVYNITGEFFTARTNINPREKGILVMTAEDLAFVSRCLRAGKSRTNKLVTVSAPGMKPKTVRIPTGATAVETLVRGKAGSKVLRIHGFPETPQRNPSFNAGWCPDRGYLAQSSTFKPRTLENSFVLCVTNIRLFAKAMAAICRSRSLMGTPFYSFDIIRLN